MHFDQTVLQVIPELETGGAERTTVEIAQAIIAAGGRALVATHGGRMSAEILAAGGEVFPMPVHSKNPAEIWANRGRLLSLIRAQGVDIVHVRSRAPAWSALWAARAAGKLLVATYHGAYRATNPLKKLYNSAMIRADLVIANSAFTAAAINAQYDLKGRVVQVIPRGADLARFDPAAVSAARIEQLTTGWGLAPQPGAFRLLLPARLTPWKGQAAAIAAVARLAKGPRRSASGQAPDLQLVLAGAAQGRDDYEAALRRDVETRGVRDMVHLVGDCADMPAAVAWADVVLSPSIRPEAFGRVAVEAGAMGKPVIASDHGGARETVADGVSGMLTPPGDIDALADAVAAMMAMSDAERGAMGAKAQERVRERYSSDAMCRATIEAYAALAK
jgi:glycosyltransferase involved in cell wall biosynthesis